MTFDPTAEMRDGEPGDEASSDIGFNIIALLHCYSYHSWVLVQWSTLDYKKRTERRWNLWQVSALSIYNLHMVP